MNHIARYAAPAIHVSHGNPSDISYTVPTIYARNLYPVSKVHSSCIRRTRRFGSQTRHRPISFQTSVNSPSVEQVRESTDGCRQVYSEYPLFVYLLSSSVSSCTRKRTLHEVSSEESTPPSNGKHSCFSHPVLHCLTPSPKRS
jgi:hypothetical protein